jgi:hypothetical protein
MEEAKEKIEPKRRLFARTQTDINRITKKIRYIKLHKNPEVKIEYDIISRLGVKGFYALSLFRN